MRKTLIIGFAAAWLGLGTLGASPSAAQGTPETMQRRLIQLRTAVISRAVPAVRIKISASAAAVNQYARSCGRACDLETFLRGDLKARFTRLSDKELRVVMGLTLAESYETSSEAAAVRLNQLIQDKDTLRSSMTSLLNESHSTIASCVNNIKP